MRTNNTYNNSGIVFRNLDKEDDQIQLEKRYPGKEVTAADYKGNATIDGVEYFMDGYIKDGKKGKFMSFRFKPKQQKPALTSRPSRSEPEFDDDIPF
jgi:hypothetical protein